MPKAVRGDPEKDQAVRDIMLQIEKVLCGGSDTGIIDYNMFRNTDLEILRHLYRLSSGIATAANYYISVRLEQSLGGVKAKGVKAKKKNGTAT